MGLLFKILIFFIFSLLVTMFLSQLQRNFNCFNNDFFEIVIPLLAFVSGFGTFFVLLISIAEKSSVNTYVQTLDNKIERIEILSKDFDTNPGLIAICKEEIDDYNDSLNHYVNSQKVLQLSSIDNFKKYYLYKLDLGTLEISQIPTSITKDN